MGKFVASSGRDYGVTRNLAALVPHPLLHLIRFHGVLAPNAKPRSAIIPSAPVNAYNYVADHADAPPPSALARIRWARLLKRVFVLTAAVPPTGLIPMRYPIRSGSAH